ncbi:MAG TPA: zinc ribbon domain-containing protein [Isosphaeraceae bacterium]|jgi:hypothetical protein|nr:zinc ribbon domain-containing protein [Isosphaeraceae bacterium]
MPATESRPRFCPHCRRPGRVDAALCDECGATLADRGYCSICERHWLLRAGDPCPKHDLPLDDTPREPDDPPVVASDWVTVGTYPHPLAAEVARLRLEAEGIPTFLDGVRITESLLYAATFGGVKLQVPRNVLPDARVLLNQSWAPPKEPIADELEDAWEELAPEPGRRRRAVMRGIIVFFLLQPLVTLAVVGILLALFYYCSR